MKCTIELEKEDYPSLREAILNAICYDETKDWELESEKLTDTRVDKIFNDLPDDIKFLACTWGTSDTEVQEKIYEHILKEINTVYFDIETSGTNTNTKPEIAGGCGFKYVASLTVGVE